MAVFLSFNAFALLFLANIWYLQNKSVPLQKISGGGGRVVPLFII
jgi:hypothetical protein